MLIGKELGPYLVEKELGSGAMGTVFLAKSKKTGDRVAIKLMSLALGSSEVAVNRFVREVAILKQLDHPNIVKYKGSGRYHGSPFYIMEYVEGQSLDHILREKTKLPWKDVIRIGIDLCRGLQHAHDKGIIHRDLKPSNLMILKDGVVKLTDFGIAKDTDVTALTAANSTVGTAAYMSPEQCRGARDISHKSDLYSMGIMFYELVTGKKPFVGETVMEVFMQHANSTKYKRTNELVPDVDILLNDLIEELMAKEHARRPKNAQAVAEKLEHIKEKNERQRRAESEPASKRKGDKTKAKTKAAAAEVAHASPGKKTSPPGAPFYTKGWFTILSLAMIALAMGALIYFAFLRTPDAESLIAQADALIASGKRDDARSGPIAEFLRYHPEHGKVGQIQRMADDIDVETLEKQMHNRRTSPLKFKLTAEEEIFRKALDYEEDGRLVDAVKSWAELETQRGGTDRELHLWGLLGEKYWSSHGLVDAAYARVKDNLLAKKDVPINVLDRLTWDAVEADLAHEAALTEVARATKENDEAALKKAQKRAADSLGQARAKWADSLKGFPNSGATRPEFLLAAKRVRELRDAK